MNNLTYYIKLPFGLLNLAWHIYKNLPPRDGEYYAVSFNVKLTPRKPKNVKTKESVNE